jgi:hypothetical protein
MQGSVDTDFSYQTDSQIPRNKVLKALSAVIASQHNDTKAGFDN